MLKSIFPLIYENAPITHVQLRSQLDSSQGSRVVEIVGYESSKSLISDGAEVQQSKIAAQEISIGSRSSSRSLQVHLNAHTEVLVTSERPRGNSEQALPMRQTLV
jgi:hypothetical protein